MEHPLPWSRLEAAFEVVARDSAHAGRVCVAVGEHKQCVALCVETPAEGTRVVRLESTIMGDERALNALVLAMRMSGGLDDHMESIAPCEHDDAGVTTETVPRGRRLLELFGHNDRLRGVHLHVVDGRLLAVSDVVCLGGSVDADLLVRRLERLARVADGMKKRTTGEDIE